MSKKIDRNKIIQSLRKASATPVLIDKVFEQFSITEIEEKISLLKACAGENVFSFYTPNYKLLSSDEQYKFEIEILKHKSWEQDELYEKHGL